MSFPPATEMFQFAGFASRAYEFSTGYPPSCPGRVGCPIRRSRDQRSLASPPGFSQRATSFIASQCQGIHQMPFSCFSRHTQRQRSSPAKPLRGFAAGVRQNQLVSPIALGAAFLSVSEDTSCGIRHGAALLHRAIPLGHNSLLHICPSTHPARPATDRRGNSVILPRFSSIFRPPLGVRCAKRLVALRGGGERARTVDLRLAKPALSQLSYTPVPGTRSQGSGARIDLAWLLVPGS